MKKSKKEEIFSAPHHLRHENVKSIEILREMKMKIENQCSYEEREIHHNEIFSENVKEIESLEKSAEIIYTKPEMKWNRRKKWSHDNHG